MDTKTVLKKYKAVLIREGIPVEKIILFGSYAKKTAKPWSDIDVCIVSPIFGKDPFDEMVRLAKLAEKVDSLIEPHPYNAKDLFDKYDPLAKEIRTYGVAV
jgi:uncharacterized protein